MSPVSRVPTPLRWIGAVALALLAAVGGIKAWRLQASPTVFRVLLLDPESTPAAGLSEDEADALNVLVRDQLEIKAGASVSLTVGSPSPLEWKQLRKDLLILRLAPRRSGDLLQLDATWGWASKLRKTGQWQTFSAPPGVPGPTLDLLLEALPLPVRKASPVPLAPRTAPAFWDYLASQEEGSRSDFARAKGLLESCAAAEPDCPAIPIAEGQLQFFKALQTATDDTESLGAAEALLVRGLALCPHHPRGTWLLSRLRTDTGSAREALELLLEARQTYPQAMPLLTGVTYASRYSGLLDLAARGEDRLDELSADPRRPVRLQVTFLYRGDWDRFERSLWTRPGDRANSTVLMMKGLLHLAQNQQETALETFTEGSRLQEGYPQFIRFCRVMRLLLEGQPERARTELDDLALSRVGLRVPDGEFTLDLAVAYAQMGELDRAQDLAEKAFYTGFTCARWYETNPLLKPIRGTPRWNALIQHIQDRQASIGARFPERRWGM